MEDIPAIVIATRDPFETLKSIALDSVHLSAFDYGLLAAGALGFVVLRDIRTVLGAVGLVLSIHAVLAAYEHFRTGLDD